MMMTMDGFRSTEDFYDLPDRCGAAAIARLKEDAARNAGVTIEKLISPLYRESDSSRLHPKMLAAAKAWNAGSRGLGFVGKTGIGKTRCMYSAIRRIIEDVKIEHRPGVEQDDRYAPLRACYLYRIPSVESINDAALAKLVMASCRFDDDTNAERRLKSLYSADVLFIDDIGQSKITERIGAEIYELIETRTAKLKPILFTSNFRGKALAEKFTDTTRGDAIVRRLAEFCEIVKGDE